MIRRLSIIEKQEISLSMMRVTLLVAASSGMRLSRMMVIGHPTSRYRSPISRRRFGSSGADDGPGIIYYLFFHNVVPIRSGLCVMLEPMDGEGGVVEGVAVHEDPRCVLALLREGLKILEARCLPRQRVGHGCKEAVLCCLLHNLLQRPNQRKCLSMPVNDAPCMQRMWLFDKLWMQRGTMMLPIDKHTDEVVAEARVRTLG